MAPSDNSSEDESDEETSKRKKKTVSKKRKNVPSSIAFDGSSQLLEQVDEATLSTQNSLYDVVISPENDLDAVAEKWVKEYQRNQKSALRNLINFVIRSAGCPLTITAGALDETDGSVDAIEELQGYLSKLPHTEYPIISKSKELKFLRRNMLLLFQTIIIRCKYEAIYDGMLIETLQTWLTTMSSSTYRPFRHTATLVGLKIVSALCEVGESLRHELATTNSQLNAAKKGSTTGNNRAKLNQLKQKSTNTRKKCDELEEFLSVFFNGIFVHRTRDVESIIRVECIKELCNWIQTYQSYFTDNTYLRFLGWAFNDQSASVRSESIKSLIRLYKIEDVAQKLSVFTRRFKTRIEEMALYDVDVSVRVNTIQLCSALYKLNIDILSANGRKELSNMIASDAPRVRKSAAPFVKAMIDTNIIHPLLQQVSNALSNTRSKGRRSAAAAAAAETTSAPVIKAWVNFKGLASFIVKHTAGLAEKENTDDMQVDMDSVSSSLIEKRTAMITNIVEALWDQMSELQDYTSMSDYLCRDHSQTQQQQQQDDDQMDTGNTSIEDCYRLNDEEETVLINVFVVCVRTAITKGLDKNMPEGRDKKKLDDAFWEENKNEISRHLVQALPKLLSKHSDDTTRMSQLVCIPALMNLSVFSELRAEKQYEELLETLSRVYLGAISTDLLTNCADSLQHMTKNTGLLEINNIHFTELKEAVVNQVREACNGKDLVTAHYTPALIHSISVSMLRLACLINFIDATAAMEDSQGMGTNVIEYVGALIDRATYGYEKEQHISQSALTIISRFMMWKCNSINSSTTTDIIPAMERRRDWAFDKLVEVVTGNDVQPVAEIRVAAFGHLVDMYWLFTSDIFDEFGLNRLRINCPSDLQEDCTKYVSEEITSLNALVKDAEGQEESVRKQKDLVLKLVTSYSRGVIVGVFDIKYSAFLLEQYGVNHIDLDDTIKALVTEFEKDLITGEVAADGICRAYLDALKKSFNHNVGDSSRSIDKTLKLARLEALSLKHANQADPARQAPAHIICERIHLDGISFALSKAAEAYDNNQDDLRDNALKFFKILAIFGKELTRARDIAKIHNHLEDCLQQHGLVVEENKKEWEHYVSYVKVIDEFLKKKGLRYDSTKRANNAETPAAHVFNDVELDVAMDDIEELNVRDNAKRTLVEAEMDIDEDLSTKRRRD